MSTNIYLDIDGVLLANELHPAKFADEFLLYVLTNYPDTTYWLTTHCRGDANVPTERIGSMLEYETVKLMKLIKPSSWDIAKTEAIDFSKPFLWFDDDLMSDEPVELVKHNAYDSWIQVNLYKNPNQLKKFLTSFPMPV